MPIDPIAMKKAVVDFLMVAHDQQRKAPAKERLDDPEYVAEWVQVLTAAKISPADIMPGYRRYAAESEYFPAPKNIIGHARAAANDRRISEAARPAQAALPTAPEEPATPEQMSEIRAAMRERLGISERERERILSDKAKREAENRGLRPMRESVEAIINEPPEDDWGDPAESDPS